ncbi:PAS domain S-box protein [Tumebacillus sp. ITR2]|uniref:histidine kinase n=1 Tax=Tumebacillus amylolyticus TaxID=2801339 RepID=A0ABS1JGA7_9BACL|nr:ATP-binding protein [Tumebacillus amylolyticus]MBL0389320.1 PAS domain S-box protein [Tumebacillus amylolyticus]
MKRKLSMILKLLLPALLLLCTTIVLVLVALHAMYDEKREKLSALSATLQHRMETDPSISFASAIGNDELLYQRFQRLLDETFPKSNDLSGSLFVVGTNKIVAYAPIERNPRTLPYTVETALPREFYKLVDTHQPQYYFTTSKIQDVRVYNYAVPLFKGDNVYAVLNVNQSTENIDAQTTVIWVSGLAVCLISLTAWLGLGIRNSRRERHLQREQDNLINWLKTYDGDSLSVETLDSQFDLLKDLPQAFQNAVDLIRFYRHQQRQALDQMPVGLVTLDETGRVVYVNPYFSSLFGYGTEEMRSWTPEFGRSKYRMLDSSQPLREMSTGRRVENRIGLITNSAGEEVPVSVTLRELPKVQDEPTGWLVICYDLSQEFALDRLTQQTQVLLQSVALNVLLLDANLQIEHMSPALCKLVGRRELDLIGQRLPDVTLLQFEEGDHTLIQAVEHVLTRGYREHLPQKLASVLGREYVLEFDLFPILNPLTQEADGCMIFVKDITLYQEWELLSRRVDAHSNYVQMAATIAHEVRNPMTSVRGFLQLLAKDLQGGEHQMYLDVMQAEIDRMNAILTEYLSMARPAQSLEWEGIHLAELVRETFLVLKGEANYRGVELGLKLTEGFRLEGNPRELKQVVINLVRNAFDAIEQPDGRIEIRLNEGVLEIADNGCGMSPAQIERIFEPFFTTKATGTGLGLPVCHKIVESHNGTLEVTSEPGVGTVFTIRF